MSCRVFMIRLRRQALVIVVCGLLCCVVIVVLLSLCNSQVDSMEAYKNSAYKRYNEVLHENTYRNLINTNLFIIVISSPFNTPSRNVIRQTWASNLPKGVVVKFVIGIKNLQSNDLISVTEEQNRFKDLLILHEFEDSYSSLTSKLLTTLQWITRNVKLNFLMKVDEDSFVRVDKIMEELLHKPQNRLYWGFFDGRAHVKKIGKWQEKDYVLCDRYLPYALGGGYILSADLVEYISINSKYFKQFKSEDVSVGTWLGPLDIDRIHDPRFDTEYKSRGCFNSYIVTHKKTAEDMHRLHENLQTKGELCLEEKRVRLSYKYNWSNLPTQCCERRDPAIP